MGKKKNYGDLRYLNPELFQTDIMTSENFQNYSSERDKLQSLYDEYDVKTPVVGELVNVVYVGISQGYFNFDGGFKDFVSRDHTFANVAVSSDIEFSENANEEEYNHLIEQIQSGSKTVKISLNTSTDDNSLETEINIDDI